MAASSSAAIVNPGNYDESVVAGPQPITITLQGGAISFDSITDTAADQISIVLGSNVTWTIGSGTLNGAISGAGSLVEAGQGTLTLLGSNVYTGSTTINEGGTLQIGNGGESGSIGGNQSGTTGNAIIVNGTLAFDTSTNFAQSGTFQGTGTLIQAGSGTLTLTGFSSFSGTTAVEAGALIVNGSPGTGSLTDSGGTLGGDGIIGGAVTAASGVIEAGTSTSIATLNTGSLTLSSGTSLDVKLGLQAYDKFNVNGAATLGGATLNLTAGPDLPVNTTYTIINASSINGKFAGLQQGSVIDVGSGADMQTLQIWYNANTVTLIVLAPSTFYVYSGWADLTAGTLVTDPVLTGGRQAVIGTNAFASVSGAVAANTDIPGSTIIVNAGSYNEDPVLTQLITLVVQADSLGVTVNIGSLADTTGAAQIQIPAGDVLNVGSDGSSTTLSSVIEGGGQFVKSGVGTMTFAGNETLSGNLTVNSGTLVLTGTTPETSVNVETGAAFSGIGAVASLTDNGVLSLGEAGQATLTTAGLTFTNGTLNVNLNGACMAGTGPAQIISSGTVNLSNEALKIDTGSSPVEPGTQFTVIASTAPINGTFAGLPEGSTITTNGQTFAVSYQNDDISLTTTVPTFYVSSTWAGEFTNGQTIPDADPLAPGNQPATFGVNAFATVDAAIATAPDLSNVVVNQGTYNEDVVVNKPLNLTLQQGPISFGSLADTVGTAVINVNGITLTVGTDNNSASLRAN